MATTAEKYRARIAELDAVIREARGKFNDDNLPSEDDAREWEAAVSERADLVEALKRLNAARQLGVDDDDSIIPAIAQGRDADAFRTLAKRQSIGSLFVQDEPTISRIKAAGSGILTPRSRFETAPVKIGALANLFNRNAAMLTGGSSTSAGAFITPDRMAEMVELGRRPLVLRDIVRILQTESDLIEYVEQTTRTNNAAVVAEATASSGSSGIKPESEVAFAVRQTAVKVIANWMAVTRQAVADVRQLRSLIDLELEENVDEELEDQALQGDGTGNNFTGIYNTSGTQSQAYTTGLLVTARKARTLVRTVGRDIANAYVMHPNDWEDFDLLTDGETRYYFGGPLVMGTPRLWGLPVVESEGALEGTALVGNFRRAILWDREEFTIRISDSHSDFFVRNLLAVLGELRAAFALTKPAAIVEVDLTP